MRVNFIEELRSKVITVDSDKIRVAKLSGSLIAKDNHKKIFLNGLIRKRHSFVTGTDKWHKVLLPMLPVCKALNLKPEECLESLIIQTPVCNIRCWFCFVDYKLINGNPDNTGIISQDQIVNFLKEKNMRIIHISGGEPIIIPEFINGLYQKSKNIESSQRPFIWVETNLTISPSDLDQESLDHLVSVMKSKRTGFVGCFKSICPEDYHFSIGNSDTDWIKQFESAKKFLDYNANFYSTLILVVRNLWNLKSKIKTFFDTAIKYCGEEFLRKIVPIEVRLYSATSDRISGKEKQLLKSQYEVLFVYKEILKSYTGQEAWEILPIEEKGVN